MLKLFLHKACTDFGQFDRAISINAVQHTQKPITPSISTVWLISLMKSGCKFWKSYGISRTVDSRSSPD
jgi:hypothetical protein